MTVKKKKISGIAWVVAVALMLVNIFLVITTFVGLKTTAPWLAEGREITQRTDLFYLGSDWKVEKSGGSAISYLKHGSKWIGGGYHSYYFEDGNIIGKLGATREVVVDKEGNINNDGGSDGRRLAEIEREKEVLNLLGVGWAIKKSGALKYLIEDGERKTSGYHHFFLSREREIIGKLGATKTVLDLP